MPAATIHANVRQRTRNQEDFKKFHAHIEENLPSTVELKAETFPREK